MYIKTYLTIPGSIREEPNEWKLTENAMSVERPLSSLWALVLCQGRRQDLNRTCRWARCRKERGHSGTKNRITLDTGRTALALIGCRFLGK